MNTRKGKEKFNFFHSIEKWMYFQDCNGKDNEKLVQEKDDPMQWNIHAWNITTNIKVKIDFTLPALSATNVMMWKCHADDSDKGRYDMISGRDLLTELGLNIELSEHVIKAYDGPFNESTIPMVDLCT